MRIWGQAFVSRAARMAALLLAIVCGVSFLMEGIELTPYIVAGKVSVWSGIAQMLAPLPVVVVGVGPLVGAIGVGLVVHQWRGSMRIVALQTMGWSPVWLVVPALVLGLLVAGVSSVTREVAVGQMEAPRSALEKWVFVKNSQPHPQGVDAWMVRAERAVENYVTAVELGWYSEGQLVGTSRVEEGWWENGRWRLNGDPATLWNPKRSQAEAALPPLKAWQDAAVVVGPHSSFGQLLSATPSDRRTLWLVERGCGPVVLGLWAMLAVPVVLVGRRWGLPLLSLAVVLWSVFQGGAMGLANRGIWPVWFVLIVPLLILVVGLVFFCFWLRKAGIGSAAVTK